MPILAEITNSNPLIINLGAGLDTRSDRLDLGSGNWYDIDLPEVIQLRRMFFNETEQVKFIAKSILDFSWIDKISSRGIEKPLLIAEGLFMYFNETDIKRFFNKITKAFPQGIVLAEIFHSFLLRTNAPGRKETGQAKYLWGISNAKAIESLNPDLHVVNEWRIFDYNKNRQSLFVRINSLFSPVLRDLIKILEIHFDKKSIT